jgi:hypothetical protein
MNFEHLIRHVALAILLTALLVSSSCFEPLSVEISEDNPPTFILRGGASGFLGGVSVYEYPESEPPIYVWSTGSRGKYISLSYFGPTRIKYGEPIDGWVQDRPAGGLTPPLLVEGKTYQVDFLMFDVGSRRAVFTIRNGKAVQQN